VASVVGGRADASPIIRSASDSTLGSGLLSSMKAGEAPVVSELKMPRKEHQNSTYSLFGRARKDFNYPALSLVFFVDNNGNTTRWIGGQG